MTPAHYERAQRTDDGAGHTALPWSAEDCGNDAEWDIVQHDAEAIDGVWYVATCHDAANDAEAEANAAFIVRACNSHYELLEALEAVAPYLNTMLVEDDPDDEAVGWEWDEQAETHTKPIDFTMGAIRKVNTAIAKAREVAK